MNPDHIQVFQINGQPHYVFWYGCPDGASHRLPVGTVFDVAYSSSPYQTRPRWHKVRFAVILVVEAYGKHKGDVARKYRQVAARDLDEHEIRALERLLKMEENRSELAV